MELQCDTLAAIKNSLQYFIPHPMEPQCGYNNQELFTVVWTSLFSPDETPMWHFDNNQEQSTIFYTSLPTRWNPNVTI